MYDNAKVATGLSLAACGATLGAWGAEELNSYMDVFRQAPDIVRYFIGGTFAVGGALGGARLGGYVVDGVSYISDKIGKARKVDADDRNTDLICAGMNDVEKTLVTIINDIRGYRQPLRKSSLNDDLELDSLDNIEFIMDIEDRFGISIPNDDAERLTTFEEAAKYVSDAIAKKAKGVQ